MHCRAPGWPLPATRSSARATPGRAARSPVCSTRRCQRRGNPFGPLAIVEKAGFEVFGPQGEDGFKAQEALAGA
jgi:hypothetical protein